MTMILKFCMRFSIACFMATVIRAQLTNEKFFLDSRDDKNQNRMDKARGMRDASTNSYAKKFLTKLEAEKYITDFNFKIVDKVESTKSNLISVKRKRSISPENHFNSLKDHIKKIKTAFNDLQAVVASFSGLTATHVDQVKMLNDEVFCKLNKILNVNSIEFEKDTCLSIDTNIQFLRGSPTFAKEKDKLSSNANFDYTKNTELSPSELEAAKKMFSINDKNEVIVYTDGACSNNGYDGASAGAGVWFGNGNPLNLSVKVPGTQTNNNAEIFSSIRAIEQVKMTGSSRVSIHTDSDFVIKSINQWMPRWKLNGWKTKSGNEVKNKEMFEKLDQCINSMDSVSWNHVRGHVGIIGNEEADKLARMGAKK